LPADVIDFPVAELALARAAACGVDDDGRPFCWEGLHAADPSQNEWLVLPTDASYTGFSLGELFACGIQSEGTAECFGADGTARPPSEFAPDDDGGIKRSPDAGNWCGYVPVMGQLDAPDEHFVQLSSAGYTTCGVTRLGELACWGAGTLSAPEPEEGCNFGNVNAGQGQPPAGDGFRQVDTGSSASCAVRVDGSVACWGSFALECSAPGMCERANEITGPFDQVTVGDRMICGLRPDRELVCWGPPHAGLQSIFAASP
jgi:alpha-tubulin suppressor-like RCC1 family protein